MTLGFRTTAAACIAACFLLSPGTADAQGRQAVLRSRPAVRVGVYYGPAVYRGWYASPYLWYDPFYYPYYPYPYFYGQVYPPYYYGYPYDNSASLRLQVSPRETQVFVDGYYAGTVDDFDGIFQRLHVQPGEHNLELFLPGHRSLQQKIYLQPGKTFTVKHTMEQLGPGESEPVRPVASARPAEPRAGAPRGFPPPVRPRERDQDRDADSGQPVATGRAEFGSLSLRVQPGGAHVMIDGEPWEGAENERLVVQLGAGVHNVEIQKDGYRTYITDVTVRAGETATINVALTPNR